MFTEQKQQTNQQRLTRREPIKSTHLKDKGNNESSLPILIGHTASKVPQKPFAPDALKPRRHNRFCRKRKQQKTPCICRTPSLRRKVQWPAKAGQLDPHDTNLRSIHLQQFIHTRANAHARRCRPTSINVGIFGRTSCTSKFGHWRGNRQNMF